MYLDLIYKDGTTRRKFQNGTKYWFKNGLLHRDNDLPAIVYTNGTKEWYKNDKPHRDNDQPAIIRANGTKYWFKNGVEYGPCMPYKKW